MRLVSALIIFVMSPLLLIADVTVWHNVYLYIAPMVSNNGALFLTVVSSLISKGLMIGVLVDWGAGG